MKNEELFNQTRLLFHALKHWAEALHQGPEVSIAMRAVLERILLGGAATVPDIARARGVSRQHIQQQVDALTNAGLVERQKNPAHRRSPLIALSDRGRALIQNLRAEELDALSQLQVGVSDNAVVEAAQVLSAWRAALLRDAERRAS
jgi:DNA-binding MarR family transcriptional regulator